MPKFVDRRGEAKAMQEEASKLLLKLWGIHAKGSVETKG